MSDQQDYAEHLRGLTALVRLDDGLRESGEKLLVARQSDLHAGASKLRSAAKESENLAAELIAVERRVADIRRRHPVQPGPTQAVPADLGAYRAAIGESAREVEGIETADAWLRRARQQLVQESARQPAPASAPQPAPEPVAESAPTRAKAGFRLAWYWWVSGLVAVCAGVGIAVATLVGGA